MARNENELRLRRLQNEITKVLEKAREAELESKLLLASHFYKVASELYRKNDDAEMVRELHKKAESLLKQDLNLNKNKTVERVKNKAKKIISSIKGQLKIALKAAELCIDKEKHLDAFLYYEIAKDYFLELGDKDRADACKRTASEFKRLAIDAECKKITEYYEKSLIEESLFK